MSTQKHEGLIEAGKRTARELKAYQVYEATLDAERGEKVKNSFTPRELVGMLTVFAAANQPTLLSQKLSRTPFIDKFVAEFSKSQLLQAFDICVTGLRKELAQTTHTTRLDCLGFGEAIGHVITADMRNRNPQLNDLSRDEYQPRCIQLEQLATECERKATELCKSITAALPKSHETLYHLLKIAGDLRDQALILQVGYDPELGPPKNG